MGLFDAISEMVKLPFDIAKDVVTMGGALTEEDKPSTVKRLEKSYEELDN